MALGLGTKRAAAAVILGGAGAAVLGAALLPRAGEPVPAQSRAALGRPAPKPPAAKPPAAKPHVAAPSPAPAPAPAPAAYVVRRVLPIDGPIRHGDWYWDEKGAPATGTLVITIDLDAQVLSAFRDGYEIGTTAITYGADTKPTPLGVFPITQKDADHVSNLYRAPMPYMLRLTGDGVSIHAGEVNARYATHGCVGVPLPFARRLFGAARLGDRVIITRGERLAQGEAIKAA